MDTRTPDHKQHPVIMRYVETDLPLIRILEQTPKPYPPLVQALIFIEECLERRRLAKDAIQAAEAVTMADEDPEVLILMLSAWAELACRINRPSDAEALIQRAKALISETTCPEVFVRLVRVESIIADTTGNKSKCESLMKDIMSLLPKHSQRRKFYVWEHVLFLARQGRAVEARPQIPELIRRCSDNFLAADVMLVQFVNAVETGQADEAQRLMTEIAPASTALNASGRSMYFHYRGLLKLMKEAMTNVRLPIADSRSPLGGADSLTVIQCLIARETDAALRLARIEAGRLLDSIFASGFDSFNLVRAELSAGHWEAARRLLTMRNARGNKHYLDNLFLARADLLAGNSTRAARRFAEVLKAVKRFEAAPRLDFELLLACELTPMRLVELSRLAEQTADEPSEPGPEERSISEIMSEAPKASRLIVGQSKAIAELRRMIEKLADIDAPVLITGETGTGKDLVARALHEASKRSKHPFSAVNCGAIAETLLESELFGHMRGAFTGADRNHVGLFEQVGEGTVFLDEIGDVPMRLQTALLRVLETGEIRPVGCATSRRVLCRILAATNADLVRIADQGEFRKDLLFRLQRLTVHITSLRERREDIMLLVRYFIDAGRKVGTHAILDPALGEVLRSYDWPGNVRELRNVIERMRLMHSDKLSYSIADLDLKFHPGALAAQATGQAADAAPPVAEPRDNDRGGPHLDARSQIRRLDSMRELFKKYGKLTRHEVTNLLGVSPNTATKDLKVLVDEGSIVRVEPSASTRSHYFALKNP